MGHISGAVGGVVMFAALVVVIVLVLLLIREYETEMGEASGEPRESIQNSD
jgi:hypothetical protein